MFERNLEDCYLVSKYPKPQARWPTYDRAASLATISENDIDAVLCFERLVMLGCLGLLFPS